MKKEKGPSGKRRAISMHAFDACKDPKLVCRRILLNTLTRGPAPVEKTIAAARRDFGFTRAQVVAAASWFAAAEVVRGGVLCWIKPDVLVALPGWDTRKPEYRESRIA
jgi:hypothetical protein